MNVCFIGARKGSRRLPGKNKRILNGKPLFARTIEASLESGVFDHVLFSTDDEDILEIIASDYPDVIPHRRPEELATPDVPIWDVIRYLEDSFDPIINAAETVTVLTPCHPFRNGCHIKEAFRNYLHMNALTLVCITPLPCPPELALDLEGTRVKRHWKGIVRIGEFPQRYYQNGAITIVNKRFFLETNDFFSTNTFGFIMDWPVCLDIDRMEDFQMAEKLIAVDWFE